MAGINTFLAVKTALYLTYCALKGSAISHHLVIFVRNLGLKPMSRRAINIKLLVYRRRHFLLSEYIEDDFLYYE